MSSAESLLQTFYDDVPPRPLGTETEYTLQHDGIYPPFARLKSVEPYGLFYNEHRPGTFPGVWLKNGGKLYYDMADFAPASFGDTPTLLSALIEYATPEYTSAADAAIGELAGGELVRQIGAEIVGNAARPDVYKRTGTESLTFPNGETRPAVSAGHHENYTTPIFFTSNPTSREGIVARHVRARHILTSYLATRPIWAGAGFVTNDGYLMSQKFPSLDFSDPLFPPDASYRAKKVLLRAKPNLLEIVAGDGNMSPWAIRTKLAMTSLVLRLVEHDTFPPELVVAKPRHAARAAATHYGERFSELPMTAVEHQRAIARRAIDFGLEHDVPDEELQAAFDVVDVCDALQRGPEGYHHIVDRVDWAAKYLMITRRLGMMATDFRAVTAHDFRAVKHDLLWEGLGPHGLGERHYRSRKQSPPPSDIVHALHVPPESRAADRVAVLKNLPSKTASEIFVDWEQVDFGPDGDRQHHRWPTAYKSQEAS